MHHNICTPLRFKAATTQQIRHQTPDFIMAWTKMKLRKKTQVQSSIQRALPHQSTAELYRWDTGKCLGGLGSLSYLNSAHFYKAWF